MENSPPGIQTIPFGAGPGEGLVFGTVGPKAAEGDAGGFEPACRAEDRGWKKLRQNKAETNKKGARLRRVRRETELAG